MLCAGTAVLAQSALTPEQLTLRVERLTELSQRSDAKLSSVQEQLKTLSEDMDRMGRLVDNRAMLEMIQQVDQISEDINLLRGEVEQLQWELADRDQRLTELQDAHSPEPPDGAGETPQLEDTSKLVGRLEELLDELEQSDRRIADMEQLLRSADEAAVDQWLVFKRI